VRNYQTFRMCKSILTIRFLGLFQFMNAQSIVEKDSEVNFTNNNQVSKLMEELLIVKSDIIRLLKQIDNKEWQIFHLTIEAPPFINKGFNSTPVFLDSNGNKIKVSWKGDEDYSQKVFNLIFQMNQKEIRNQIIFFANRSDYDHASIFTSFSQDIEETFQSRLPKSMRGKTVAWFKTND
jgi:hypothetical protein